MPLPQQVIDRLAKESPSTPGWSPGMLLFSGGIFFLILLTYAGVVFGYEPYVDGQIAQMNAQIDTIGKSVSPADENNLITFYSQVTNLRATLAKHIASSKLLAWLEKNTEGNVYYTTANYSPGAGGASLTLTGYGKTQADVIQQMEIFQQSPDVLSVNVPSVSLADSGWWQFSAALIMNPAIIKAGISTTP